MRNIYERPLMRVEMFVANNAVSTCTVEGGVNYTFDCMVGPNTDPGYVINDTIASGCNTKIGYAPGYSVARDYSSGGSHSNNNSGRATWTTVRENRNSYLQVTYSGAEGLLYTDGNSTTDSQVWSVNKEGGYVQHSSNSGEMHHMIAPVVDSRSINASW